ncbi:Hsp20/alpha crystallin family protein [Leptospira inadai serovar Lyme str. 10]|uniref:Hsp20/alpha crystallin family protein n=2 Tax=Leptospira inadai serovar Lyme TaxID=293084 RepID=V6HID8_9LEPT|nr:Hsp20/alpha crystallin family protein [Leptospira inadai]EQA36415.1 Hsp20/alpha crystallin family protein [Leptospira inadai serovar Lyme str. 10]PNV76487.1 Hsp20/alpha crystallin family protein [Leptospira inadai serovar Lyme]
MRHQVDLFHQMRRMQNRIHNLFDPVWEGGRAFPAVNVYSNEDRIIVTAEVPGLSPEDLEITVAHNLLTIHGEIKDPAQESGTKPRRLERSRGKFKRALELPVAVDSEKVQATVKDGVLTLALPVQESEKPRRIKIETQA